VGTVDRLLVLPLLVVGGVGMVVLGTVEAWAQRASGHVDADSPVVLALLAGAPLGVMVGAWSFVHRRLVTRGTPALAVGGRTGRVALAGWALLTVAAVLVVQGVLFAVSSALVGMIGCGSSDDDWCGFGSAIFAVLTLAAGSTCGVIGSVLWLVTRRAASRSSRG